jgi:hypothetical protein
VADVALADLEPNTEPLPDPSGEPVVAPPPRPETAFDRAAYVIPAAARNGEAAYIRGDDGTTLFGFRGFASVVGIVAAVTSAIVLIAGAASVIILALDARPLPAVFAALLTAAFSVIISMLVPATRVTVYEGTTPAFGIVQQSSLSVPSVTFAVVGRDGRTIARLASSALSRLGRRRWRILAADADRPLGDAVRRFGFQTNYRIRYQGAEVGQITRKGDSGTLDLSADPARTLDRRVALAVAMVVLGMEP